MKLRSLYSALVAGIAVLLALAAGSLLWILAQSPLSLLGGGTTATPEAAIFVSKQAPAMVSLLINPDRLESFWQFSTAVGQRQRAHQEFDRLKTSLLANTGLDYEKDIRPWLGNEITLAVTSLDFDRDRENGVRPGYLLAVTTKNPELAREFLQLSFSQSAIAGTSDLIFEPYKGVNLIYQRPLVSETKSTIVASAVVGDFVLFANSPEVLKEAINSVQASDLNLQNAPAYQEALSTIGNPRVGFVYANLPALSAWVVNAPVPEAPEAEQLLTIAFAIDRQGLAAETALIGITADDRPPALAEPVGTLRYVPANSALTAAGSNLNGLWTQIETGIDPNSPLQQLLTQTVNRIQTPLGLNLPQDIFSWVQGEYALSLLSSPQQKLEWVFVAEKVPTANAETAIEQLDVLAKRQGLSVGNLPLFNTQVTAWTQLVAAEDSQSDLRLNAQVQGVHTTVNKYEIFATSIEALAQAIAETSLLDNEKFQGAIASLPTENDGYFYLDWSQCQPIIEQQIPLVRLIEVAGKPLFDNLRSLTLSSRGSTNGVRRATVFFNLGVS